MSSLLDQEFKYYVKNQETMLKDHTNEYVVICGEEIIDFYKNELDAIEDAQKNGLVLGTFLVQLVSPGEDSYTQTYHSRVAFL